VANTTMIDKAQEKERATLDALYERLEVGKEALDMSSKTLGAEIGVGDRAAPAITLFEELGILRRRMEYGNATTNGLPFGRHYHWTLVVPKDEAVTKLAANQAERRAASLAAIEAGRKKQGKTHAENSAARKAAKAAAVVTPAVTLATDDTEEVRAIAGEEPDRHLGSLMNESIRALRKDDAAALIEAARQYTKRTTSIDAKIDELAKLAAEVGISFDREKAHDAVRYDTDERLEAIKDVLPYIEKLEASVERLSKQLVTQSGKVRDYDNMANENRRLRDRVESLISRNVGQAIAKQAQA
jgi:hypothetical protein